MSRRKIINSRLFILALGMWQCMTFVSCGGGDDKEKEAALCAERFAHCYFNFKYVDALAYTTEDSRRVLEFCASNMSRKIVDSLKNITDTPTVSVVETSLKSDSEAECRIKVENGIFIDTIGGYPVPGQREKSFRFMLVKEGKEWKIRMANLPRSEK